MKNLNLKTSRKVWLLILIITYSINSFAQQEKSGLYANIYQDFKLAFLGDDKLNDAGTLNFIGEVNLTLRKEGLGYPMLGFTYEYSDLTISKSKNGVIKEPYQRLAIQFGYLIDDFVFKDFDAVVKVSWGAISRFEVSKPSWGMDLELIYNINDWIGFSAKLQGVERSDINFNYPNPQFDIDFLNTNVSGFIGVKIKLSKVRYSGTYADY